MLNFLVSHYEKQQVRVVAILITPIQHSMLESFRERFGPWMFIGVKQLTQQAFLESYSSYIPQQVTQALQHNHKITYACELELAIGQ